MFFPCSHRYTAQVETFKSYSHLPALSVPERIEYLRKQGFIGNEDTSTEDEEALSRVVFHFLMGYARNFRKKFGTTTLQELLEIYQLDQQVSLKIFEGVQMVERRLRQCYVEAYVKRFSPYGVYLQDDSYQLLNMDGQSVAVQIRRQILRSSESYIQHKADPLCQKWGMTRKELAGSRNTARQIEALVELPIWATIDWWSFGTLAKAISSFRGPVSSVADDALLWKGIAGQCGVSQRIFIGQLEGVTVLRNLVGHHNRLWMRPSVSTPRIPNIYRQENRSTHPKSMYVPMLTLASFLEGMGHGRTFKNELDELLAENLRYKEGIRQIGAN